jgi:hypothetical protein
LCVCVALIIVVFAHPWEGGRRTRPSQRALRSR